MTTDNQPALQPPERIWTVHRTGGHIGIKDQSGRFVIRKTVNKLTIEQYRQLSADFDYIVLCVNECSERARLL